MNRPEPPTDLSADLSAQSLLRLAQVSYLDPERGGRVLLGLGVPLSARWMALAAAITIGTVIAYLGAILGNDTEGLVGPMVLVGMQVGANVVIALGASFVGRLFGGRGSFDDAILLLAWMQALMIGLQILQIVAALVLPGLEALVLMLAFFMFFWLLSGLICALHGFRSRALVLLGIFGTLFACSFVVAFILMALGIDPASFITEPAQV